MISAILFIARFLGKLAPLLARMGKYFGFVWRFLKRLSNSPIGWIIVSVMPIVDLIAQVVFGKSIGVNLFFSNLAKELLNLIITKIPQTSLQGEIDNIPETVANICCYLGVSQAFNVVVTGLISAISTLLALRFSLFLVWLRWKTLGYSINKLTRM